MIINTKRTSTDPTKVNDGELTRTCTNSIITVYLLDAQDLARTPIQDHAKTKFNPLYTYPFYGDSQLLVIDPSATQDPFLNIYYAYPTMAMYIDASSQDLVHPLLEYLPEDVVYDLPTFLTATSKSAYRPPGTKIHEYSHDKDVYEIYKVDLKDQTHCQQLVLLYDRIKILSLFLIEAANVVDLDDPNWVFVLLFRKTAAGHQLIGFVSLYAFFMFPKDVQPEGSSKYRISQFMVLPPFQRCGHAVRLYTSILNYVVTTSTVQQLTIEDTSEAMDCIRDLGDLAYIMTIAADKLATVLPGLETDVDCLCTYDVKCCAVRGMMAQFKFTRRQAERILELLLLFHMRRVPSAKYRLLVKARIFRTNRDVLVDNDNVDTVQRKALIHQTYLAVLDEYQKCLLKLDKLL